MVTLSSHKLTLHLADEDATARLGAWLAGYLERGDCLLLQGQIGAGKSHLARALIRQKLGRMEDVPSPTFTLVQTYQAEAVEIWHADLYRLTHPDEVMELGLDGAFAEAITLIEWPDRLGHDTPDDALHLALTLEGEGRRATFSIPGRDELADGLRRDWGAVDV